MIFLKFPKSSEFAIVLTNSGQKSLTMFISSSTFILIFLKIGKLKKKKVSLRWDSNPQLSFEATEHLRNIMRKENC